MDSLTTVMQTTPNCSSLFPHPPLTSTLHVWNVWQTSLLGQLHSNTSAGWLVPPSLRANKARSAKLRLLLQQKTQGSFVQTMTPPQIPPYLQFLFIFYSRTRATWGTTIHIFLNFFFLQNNPVLELFHLLF